MTRQSGEKKIIFIAEILKLNSFHDMSSRKDYVAS